ncbi:MAG: DUF4349 domain-containing protein [Phycisphaerales bacterium]|nr:DUF4349 domain-containing protein [Phycisphaerales bacterium]
MKPSVRLTALLGLVFFCGCASTKDYREAQRDSSLHTDPQGSRLLLPRDFAKLGVVPDSAERIRRESNQMVDITNPASLASDVPGTFAGRDNTTDLAAPVLSEGLTSPVIPALLAVSVQDAAEAAARKRVVVYTAALRSVVGDIDASMARAKELALSCGGYVQEIRGDSIALRVPAETFEPTLAAIEALGQTAAREIHAQDVTEEYVDLEARLKAAQQMRDRLAALLEKAADVKAMLEVERELGRVNEEIEKLTGKLNVLRNKVAYSAISISFVRVAPRVSAAAGARQLPFYWLRQLHPDRLWD